MSKRVNRDDIDKFHDYSLYVPKRTMFISSEEVSLEHGESGTDSAMAERAVKNLAILEMASQEPIKIIMNNLGGDFTHGMAIYDSIRACKSEVTIVCYGHAMSMGSIILQAADIRVMAPNASQMIHYGTWYFSGHAKTGQKWAKEYDRMDKWMEQMYLEKIHEKKPKFTLKALEKLLNFDTFLTAEQSVEMGLADKILGEEK